MKLKTGKEEIVYLLTAVFKKYEQTTGQEVIRNTNRKNYEDIARVLSKISNELPNTADLLEHDHYPPDRNTTHVEYPYLKYDITGGQIKDAYTGIVSNPRPFIVDACYIYVYGVGRKGFEKEPKDPELIDHGNAQHRYHPPYRLFKKNSKFWIGLTCFLLFVLILTGLMWFHAAKNLNRIEILNTTLKKDLKISPYKPTKAEIVALEGIWLVYIGSPQARSSDNNRYHMVVSNIVDVRYKDGYFLFNRYGASFDHLGYMQFENSNVVSIHSYIKNNSDTVESPRLSLMRFDVKQKKFSVISASWNFDVGSKNDIIGIREVYIKQGHGGEIEEVINTIANSSCRCKIVRWKHENESKSFYLRNENIDSLSDQSLKPLLDEHSILLRQPSSGLILTSEKQ
jgi:hypothetical protein